jgi:DNA primase small subunit
MTQIEQNKRLADSILRRAFREYYFKYARTIDTPNRIKQREFGIMQFGGSGMIRHLSFDNIGELVAALIREVPSDVYYSNSYYRSPTQPMHDKQWLGADLIFDIDGKDLELKCIPSHSFNICTKCKSATKIDVNKKEYSCHECNSTEAKEISVPCDNCIEASKKQVKYLIEILIEDLGIEERQIYTYFSGNNGFHITIKNDVFTPLDSQLRSEIIGYILGNGLMIESIGVRKDGLVTSKFAENGFRIKFPKGSFPYGWRNRIAKKLKLAIDNSSEERLEQLVKSNGGYEGFKNQVNRITKEMGILIDPQVTVDIHRIFRMPGTLNSKSGLAKIKCNDINSFDPFKDACLLGEEKVKIYVKTQVKLRLKEERFNLKKGNTDLPVYAAVYLICKGLAEAG